MPRDPGNLDSISDTGRYIVARTTPQYSGSLSFSPVTVAG